MERDDVAARMLAALEGNPERVASYLNSGRAESDMRELLRQRDDARTRYELAHLARLAVEVQLARVERERDRLREWVGYR